MRVLVIGAGASGLVTAKYLKQRGHDVSIVEASNSIGGTFENKRYKDAQMVSSKHLTCFSDFRRPDADMHMSLVDYVTYLQDYAGFFGLKPLVRFGAYVESLKQTAAGRYEVKLLFAETESSQTEEWDAVAICSGLHNVPKVPHFPGQEQFTGTMLHSADYKDPSIFQDKDVLIVGTGETAFDLGYQAATSGAKNVVMSTRHGFVSVPAFFDESLPPLDCIIMNWATHGWESNWAMRVGLHWWITTKFTRLGFFFMTGTTYGFNQWTGKRFNMTWDEGRKHIVNKSSKCMPLITRKVKKESPRWLHLPWWNMWDKPGVGSDIDLVEGSIAAMKGETVTYQTDNGPKTVHADVVVLATGYRQRFPFLHAEGKEDDPLPPEHFILNPDEPRLAYIGFIRPNVGAIPPMAELQAMWWCQRLEDKLVCRSPDYYKLQGRCLSYGVDYGYYMFALARELGSIPSLFKWLWRDPRVAITCAFGQAHVPIFRLDGPFESPEAVKTCSGELWKVILSRPFMMNTIFFIEALGLGAMNAFIAAFEHPARAASLAAGIGASILYKRLTSHSSAASFLAV
mmetsp:Transcript_102884/g.193516  ORF Transcript_102884/g.193516 Transcript_102884/m.193516 type:complete len:569 (+) Transcript_102884:57-1763(+)